MVIMIMSVMRETKKYFHLALVVIRMSMIVIEILAVASAEGVTQNPISKIFMALDACSEVRVWMCLPQP